jgi:hypothetical protein
VEEQLPGRHRVGERGQRLALQGFARPQLSGASPTGPATTTCWSSADRRRAGAVVPQHTPGPPTSVGPLVSATGGSDLWVGGDFTRSTASPAGSDPLHQSRIPARLRSSPPLPS